MVEPAWSALAAGRYVHWGVIQISLTNLLIIAGMVALFVIALLVPFPKGKQRDGMGMEHPDDRH